MVGEFYTEADTSDIRLLIPRSLPLALPAMQIATMEHVPNEIVIEHSPSDVEKTPDSDDYDDPLISLLTIAKERHGRETNTEITALPLDMGLDREEKAILENWTSTQLDRVIHHQMSYSSHGLHDCKRDVGPGLDAVQAGVIPECRISCLFEA